MNVENEEEFNQGNNSFPQCLWGRNKVQEDNSRNISIEGKQFNSLWEVYGVAIEIDVEVYITR